MSTFDNAYKAFMKLSSEIDLILNEDLSESDTRSKLIDVYFKEVLGWGESHIRREGHGDNGYYDYVVTLNNFSFVIEAKKTFDTFNLPIRGRRHKLRSLYKGNKPVIDQIRGYLSDTGLTHGIITNGKQFIVSRFINTDGTSWQDNDSLIFQSTDKINENFTEFYNLFSYEAIEHNGRINIVAPIDFSKKIIDSISNRNQELFRNDFSSKLLPIIDRIFNEIGNTNNLEEDRGILESCYVPTIDVHKYSNDLAGLFLDLPPTFDSKVSKAKQTSDITSSIKDDLKKDSNVPSPIILIGGKGAGKTTFIRYFFKVVLSNKEVKEIPSVYLDFRNYTLQQIEDTSSIYQRILNKLLIEQEYLHLGDYSILKQIFKQEIELKKRGSWSTITKSQTLEVKIATYIEKLTEDPITYLSAISRYLMQFQRRNLCVIFDNADQLDDESQKKIFLLSQSLRGTLKAIVFVSLREGYFYQWKNKPPFDAFHSNIYHISAPPYAAVLKKRILYILSKVTFDPINTFIDNKRVEFEGKTLKDLFKNLHHTLFSSNSNSEIMKYLEQTSYPNIRKGLEEMNNFLVSGHTKIDSYITAQPNIPIWEFIKSIGLNNKLYYINQYSAIYNIFYPNHQSSDHFIKLRILKYLYNKAKTKGFREEFVAATEVIDVFLLANYGKECIIEELDSLLKNTLLTNDNYNSDIEKPDKITADTAIRISNTGIYYLNELINRFHYIDLVLQDTPIMDKSYFDQLHDIFPKSDVYGNRNITKRLKSVELFCRYLFEQESKEINRTDSVPDAELANFNITNYISSKCLLEDKPRIEKALNL